MSKWTVYNSRKNSHFVPELLNEVGGHRNRRISFVIPDPRSKFIVATRYPELWSETPFFRIDNQRGSNHVPEVALEKLGIKRTNKIMCRLEVSRSGYEDLIIRKLSFRKHGEKMVAGANHTK